MSGYNAGVAVSPRTDSPSLLTLPVNGIELAVWDWPGSGPPLLFAHATGFHARCWDQIVRAFPERRAIAVDLRGHGRSSKPAPPYRWLDFASDLAALAEQLGIEDSFGIGHSMGGHTLAATVARRPQTCDRLLLIDPTIFPRQYYGQPPGDSSYIARRRNRFGSPDEMYQRFRDRPPFVTWRPEVLRDYCEYGLLPADDGYVLACPPEVEAAIYPMSVDSGSDIYDLLPLVRQPVTVIRAGIPWVPGVFNLNASPTAPDLASHFPNGHDVVLEGRGHYIPMEAPELVADAIRRLSIESA